MASAVCHLSELQFRCSICLEVFTDPTSLPCGHNFCKSCIERYWANKTVHTCPYCKQVFNTKPELKVNIFISEMSKEFKQSVKRKDKKQQVTKPQTKDDGNLCPEHGKVLDLFCQNDNTSICALCARRHSHHKVAPLREESEQKRLQLSRTQSELQRMIQTRQRKIQELRPSVESSSADHEISEGLRVFSALRESLDRALDGLMDEVSEKQTAAKSRAEDLIQDLEQEISELETRHSQVEQLSGSGDPLHILQNYKNLLPIPRMKDWTSAGVIAQTFEGTVARALSKLEEEFTKTTREMFEEELKRVKRFETLVTLDGDTAHPQLVVSQNGAQVNYSIEQRKVQNSLNRFDDFFVSGRQSFNQNFYFEAEVKGKTEWTLGVAKDTVNKKGPLKLDPQNGVWTIGLKNKNYFANANPEIPLSPKAKPEKIGVFVSYEEGRVSFYDVENAALIYSFSGFGFTGLLQPICSPGNYSYGNFSPLVVCQDAPGARRMTWPMKWATLG